MLYFVQDGIFFFPTLGVLNGKVKEEKNQQDKLWNQTFTKDIIQAAHFQYHCMLAKRGGSKMQRNNEMSLKLTSKTDKHTLFPKKLCA